MGWNGQAGSTITVPGEEPQTAIPSLSPTSTISE